MYINSKHQKKGYVQKNITTIQNKGSGPKKYLLTLKKL